MFLLVGLGNPGKVYEGNRHNVGFQAILAVAAHYGFPSFVGKGRLVVSEGRIQSHRVVLAMPQTFMNLSGTAVAPFASFYKIPLERCIVFHDDLDLALGKVRIKTGGGDGGHNGLKSLDQYMGKLYKRVRIGIDRPPLKEMVSGYVLGDFTNAERKVIDPCLCFLAENLELILEGKESLLMTQLSQKTRSENTNGI